MEVTIKVDETQFKDVLEKELYALKPEELHNTIIECIKEYFSANNYEAVKKLIVFRESWGAEKATDFTNKAIASCDYSELQEIVDRAIEELKTNYKRLLLDALINCIAKGLSETYTMQSLMSSTICNIMNDVQFRISNPNQSSPIQY